MEKNVDVLRDWNFWGTFSPNILIREECHTLKGSLSKDNALFIKGMRRVGKSFLGYYLISTISKDKSLAINFEDPRIEINNGKELLEFIDYFSYKYFVPEIILLDEIQNLPGWEKAVRVLVDTKKCYTVVTGSSSKLLSNEMSTKVAGRHIDFTIYPISYVDFIKFKGKDPFSMSMKTKAKIVYLEEYLKYGGIPLVVLSKNKMRLLLEYVNDIIIKDGLSKYDIKELPLKKIVRIIAENPGMEFSLRRVGRTAGICKDSVERYLDILQKVYFCHSVEKFSPKTYEPIYTNRKVYLNDVGFHTLFYNEKGTKLKAGRGL